MKNMLGRAIEIATAAHAGQVDKGGRPYILHPLWVMNKVRHLGDEYMIAGILHDVVEDTHWTLEMLAKQGFSFRIIDALALLDFRNVDYEVRIKEIAEASSENDIAKQIKLRDLEHNSKITRLKGLRPKDFDRLTKYHKAYTYLKD